MTNLADKSQSRSFELSVAVEDADIDDLGHASNITYVRWIQDVALAHSMAVGLTVEKYFEIGGVFFIRRHEIDYLRPALRGERLSLRTWLGNVNAAKCERLTDVVKLPDPNVEGAVAKVLARARTVWCFVEMATGRPTRIPQSVRAAFGYGPYVTGANAPFRTGALPPFRPENT